MIPVLILALVIVALVLAAVEEFKVQGQDLVGWGVIALSAAILIWRLT